MIRSGAQMNAPSRIFLSTSDLVSTFSRFQMPRRVCISVWQGTAKSGPCSPEGCASHADVSHMVSAMSRAARYSQALMPKPGSPPARTGRGPPCAGQSDGEGEIEPVRHKPVHRQRHAQDLGRVARAVLAFRVVGGQRDLKADRCGRRGSWRLRLVLRRSRAGQSDGQGESRERATRRSQVGRSSSKIRPSVAVDEDLAESSRQTEISKGPCASADEAVGGASAPCAVSNATDVRMTLCHSVGHF